MLARDEGEGKTWNSQVKFEVDFFNSLTSECELRTAKSVTSVKF